MDIWNQRANMDSHSYLDALRQVLDPADQKGIKNVYLDTYFKHYLMKYLDPQPHETILEIGCGNGRLTEFIAPHAKRIIGTDLIDSFIETCRSYKSKASNTEYYFLRELSDLELSGIEKVFTLGVWMYLREEEDLVGALCSYRKLLPDLKKIIFVEQVKNSSQVENIKDDFYCIYRSIKDYTRIFRRSGFEVCQIIYAGERKFAPLAKIMFEGRSGRFLYRYSPQSTFRLSPNLFYIDHLFKLAGLAPIPAETDKPIDVVFCLQPSI